MDALTGNMGGESPTSNLDCTAMSFQGNTLFRQVCSRDGRPRMQQVPLLAGGLNSH